MYYVYIMANSNNTTVYTGITNNLVRRVYEHKAQLAEGFTRKYNVEKLVYFEAANDAYEAISREKQIKKYRRQKKDALISAKNPQWRDLYNEII